MVLKSVMIDIRSKQAQIISKASKSFLLKHKEKLEVVTAFQSSYSDRVWGLAKGILNDELDKVCGAIVVLMADSESKFLEKENRQVLCHFEQLAENVVPKSFSDLLPADLHKTFANNTAFHRTFADSLLAVLPWVILCKEKMAPLDDERLFGFVQTMKQTPPEKFTDVGLSTTTAEAVRTILNIMISFAFKYLKDKVASFSEFIHNVSNSDVSPFLFFVLWVHS